MGNTAEHPPSSPAPVERRHHPRGKISEVSYVDLLDGKNGGLVLDISESGLLLQTALKVTDEEVSRLRFRLPASDQWIQARARLVWVGESGKEAGVQFLELSEDGRARIEEWVANGDIPRSPARIPGARTFPQQTTNEPPEPAPVPATKPERDVAAPSSVQQNRDSQPLSYARPRREARHHWWGLGRALLAFAILAVLLGLRYSPRLPRLPILDGSKQAQKSPVPKAVQSPSPSPLESGATGTDSTFGSTVTQTLSRGSTATKPNAAGIRSQAQTDRRAASGPQSSEAPFPAYAGAPDPSHDVILVGAPAVGAPPARVIMETEAVSASSRVAVTASRSILVPGSDDPTEKLHLGRLVSYIEPVYPADALTIGVEGTVRVRAFIDRSGEVLNLQLLSGPADLAPAAMSAIRKWRYASTLLNGQAIESQADISVFFRLH